MRPALLCLSCAAFVCALPQAARAEAQVAARPTARVASAATRRSVPPPPRVVVTLDLLELVAPEPMFTLRSELRLAQRWAFALGVGYGARPLDQKPGATVRAWELGVEPRWYAVGSFREGAYVAWATTFARERGGPIGYESLAAPSGLATGALVGYKTTLLPIISIDVAAGFAAPLLTPSTEHTPPPVAMLARFGMGFSL